MKQQVTTSIQDYLKHIYDLSKNGTPASTTDLAKRLDIKPASVTGMVQKLASAKPALVEYHKHQGVTLTTAGKKNALEVIRHHRLLETWLVKTLGYSWDEVHDEACRLEHAISEDFERRIAVALGNPTRDPHGDIIPTENLTMPTDKSQPLSALRPTQHGTIVRVNGEDPAFLRHLVGLGLVPGAQIEVTDHSQFDHNITIKIGSKSNVLGLPITGNIYVEVL
jgi:DtxR family transcriptional regulator, Mn-dependent transcriptional regulator